jgi:hypothetical protein
MGSHEAVAPLAGDSGSPPAVRLSEQFWGIRWSQTLPRRMTDDGVFVEWSSFDRALPFIDESYAEIFEVPPAHTAPVLNTSHAKARYYRAAGDFFEFRHEARTVGLLVGTPVDWSTYYVRSAAALPAYQGRKLIQRFLPVVFAELAAAGVERVEADTSPANMATMHLLTRLRFNVTGTVLTERWGAHVHFTKFLNEDLERAFLDQFCSGVKYQLRRRSEQPGRNA